MNLPRSNWSATSLAGAIFIAFAGASIAWSGGGYAWSAALLLSLALAYVIGTVSARPDLVWWSVCLCVSANLALTLFEELPFGLAGNPNYLGCASALALAGAVAYGLWWFLPFDLYSLWLSHSRGALVATGVMALIAVWRKDRLIAVGLAALALAAAFLASGNRDGGLLPRLGVWQETLNHLTFWGSGFGSFFDTYWAWPVHINTDGNLARPAHAYNDALELIFELGVGTIPLWVVLILDWEGHDARAKLVLCTFGALSLTFFPLFIPILGHLAAFSLGQLASARVSVGITKGATNAFST